MADPVPPPPESSADEFSRQAEQKAPGIVREFGDFLVHSKKWWLLPIIVALLALAVFLSSGEAWSRRGSIRCSSPDAP